MSTRIKQVYARLWGSTYGHISFSAFFIAVISGIILVVFYDINDAYKSLSLLSLTNPAGQFIRSMHYWSAQIFLIFMILHLWDHFRKSTENKIITSVWLRLTITLPVVFFVMLSGFILKADPDGWQAKRILQTLLAEIPFAGNLLSFSLLGSDENLQLVYVHHVATMSIFIWIIIIEHAKFIWPQLRTTLYFLLPIVVLSLLLPATLQNPGSTIMKGPWYFLGLQELLHYLSNPFWIIIFSVVLLLIVFLIRLLKNPGYKKWLKRTIFIFTAVYIFLIVVGYFFRGENWQLTWPWNNKYFSEQTFNPVNNLSSYFTAFTPDTKIPEKNNQPEGCLFCHDGMAGFSKAHDPQAIGCSSCHLGNTNSLQKNLAHTGMIKIPGNLDRSAQTCGTVNCHPAITERVSNSLMNTMSGVVSVNRFTFTESDSLDALYHIERITNSASDTHLRNLCASCHIGKIKEEYGPIGELNRGGGCNACHLNYSQEALKQLEILKTNSSDSLNIKYHPSLSLEVTDQHCFGCHSRSGRISTNYQGWHETTLAKDQMPADSLHRLLEDDRVFKFVSEDIHHQRGMECIDCHNSYELMGDGIRYAHQEDQVRIQCDDCHRSEFDNTVSFADLDVESAKIARLRSFDDTSQVFLKTQDGAIPLINTLQVNNKKAVLIGKNSGKSFQLNPPAEICISGTVHDRLTCNSCHSAWTPQCIGCHTEYSPAEKGIDHLTGEITDGKWIEYVGEYLAELPTLGIIKTKDKRQNMKETAANGQKLTADTREKIDTFVPGMVLTIDKSKFSGVSGDSVFKRLFAPAMAHTISLKGRSCKSCHNNPLALGYGRGELKFEVTGKNGEWKFKPAYQLLQDSLPADAWIGFLDSIKKGQTTRTNTRPFSLAEQKKILTVGACFTCHDEKSKTMLQSLDDFESVLKRVTKKCVLPF